MREKNLLIAVLALLEREGAVSVPQLARLLGTGEDEVWRALDALVFCYDSVSVRLDLHEAYATLEGTGGERLLRLNEEETGILLGALEAQGFSEDDELCSKLLEAKGFLGPAGGDAPRVPHASVQLVDSGNAGGVLECIAAACDDPGHHLLAIEYQKDGSPRSEKRIVEPHALVSKDGHLYLRAYCRTAGGWRSFRTDRVESALRLEETFAPRDDAPQEMPGKRDGGAIAHVRFAAGQELPAWPGLGRAHANPDGTRDAAVSWLGGLWLPKHIVGMMGAAIPLDPPRLVEATRAYAQELLGGTSAAQDQAPNGRRPQEADS